MTPVAAPLTGSLGTAGGVSAVSDGLVRARQGGRPRSRARILLTGLVVSILAIEVVLVVPSLSPALSRLTGADGLWVAVAVAAAAVSMGFFASTRRRLLAASGVRVRRREALAAVYVANAMHVTLPGGAAFSTAWTYRWMRARGASGPAIAWTLLAGGVLSTAVLAALGVTGSLLAGRGGGVAGVLADSAVIGLLIAALAVVRRRGDLLFVAGRRAAVGVDRLLRRPTGCSARAMQTLASQVAAVRPRSVDWLAATLFALANWIFDVCCLAASASALGLRALSVSLLLLTYTAGMAASSLSLLPAGIGIVDGAMVLALTAGGISAATALPVVLLYRLISVGAVVAAGWCIAALRPRSAGTVALGSSGGRLGSDRKVAPGMAGEASPRLPSLCLGSGRR